MTAAKRRQYGTGAVYQRSDGRWYGVIEAGWTRNGTRRRVTVSAATEAACKSKLKEKQRQIAREGLPEKGGRTTVKAWAEQWLPIVATDLRPASYNATAGAVKNWIVPTIGHKQLDKLTPVDVRAVESAQRKAGRTSSTALRTHSALMSMLRAALVEGHPVPSRVFAVDPPGKAANDRDAIPIPQALAILQVASGLPHGSRWAAAFLQGMRQAECLGLTWPAVDFAAETLTVDWQLKALPYLDPSDHSRGFRIPDGYEVRQLDGQIHLVRPKSESGQRVIPLVPWMVDALAAWRERGPQSPHGLVWPSDKGAPANVKHDAEEWKALQVTAEVGHAAGRFYVGHEARHTTATLLMELKVDPAVITAIMGHSKITTSRAYMHANMQHARAALEQVAARLQLG